MTTKARLSPTVLPPLKLLLFGTIAVAGSLMIVAGCASKEAEIPPAEVKTVTAYGITLDDSATPKQVAFVLLRSIADDVEAAQAHDRDKQKAALRITHSLGAFSAIEKNLQRLSREDPIVIQLSQNRDAGLYEFTRLWAPTVSHYIRSFDTDFETATRKMKVPEPRQTEARVLYDVCHDPAKPAAESATIEIDLSKERAGVLSYWRVVKVTFGRPRIAHSPAMLFPSCTQKSNADSQTFTVRNTGARTLVFSVDVDETWLFVSPASGTSAGEVSTITVNYASNKLAVGTHDATITISDPAADNSPARITVRLTVKSPPAITCLPVTLAPSCTQGSNAESGSFTVQNTGGETLDYSISVDQTWLSVSPASGTRPGKEDPVPITVSYSTSKLAAGTYRATITISGVAAANSPQTIAVTLTVKAPPATGEAATLPATDSAPVSGPQG